MRLKNFIGFAISALMIHILLPLFTGNPELYFFAMPPLPWTTIPPLQAAIPSSSFAQSHQATLGLDGIGWAITFFWVYSILIGITTVLFGRRLHCSHLCLFNGFAAEVFDPAIPLLTKIRHPLKAGGSLKTLRVMRVLYLLIALFFTGFWLLVPPFLSFSFATMQTIRLFELLWYLLANLILAMAFWIVSVGRLYCHLCPLGTVLAALARLGKMRIESGKTHCIGCGACDRACPMSISIKGYAMIGEPITSDQCVGCGHCIDACPTGTLSYSTAFLHLFRKKNPEERSVSLTHFFVGVNFMSIMRRDNEKKHFQKERVTFTSVQSSSVLISLCFFSRHGHLGYFHHSRVLLQREIGTSPRFGKRICRNTFHCNGCPKAARTTS